MNKIYPNIYFHEVEVNQYSVFKYPPYDLALASKMAEVTKREKLDLLHVHYAIPHAACAYLAKQMVDRDVKIVTTLHGTDITVLGYDPSLTELIRFGIEQSDAVTAVSQSLTEQTFELIEPKKEIKTIYNFVDRKIYYKRNVDDLRKQYGIEEDERVIIHVSNFRKVKRVPDVIRSFYLVQKEVKSKLLLVGDGPELTTACKLINKLGLNNKVLLLGKQENLAELYSISELKLLLSEKESFGLVLIEAMACGVPTIGTNVGGIPEVINDGVDGYICELGDIKGIAKHAISLLSDSDLHHKMSGQAISSVQQKFNSERIVNEYEDLYYSILTKKR